MHHDPPIHIPQIAPWLDHEEQNAVRLVLESGWITEGPWAATFSTQLNTIIGTPYGTFAPNGTLALYLGLAALHIGPGDEVLVPDCTFIASANAILLAGATPIFVDVTPHNYQLDITRCAALLTPRTRAIMPVHLTGMSANMRDICAFAHQHNLHIIEDAAQAIGVHYHGQHVGTFGDIGCFSFFADKTITTGEGGYIVCHDPAIYQRLLLLRNQGRIDRGSFIHPAIGYNFRITDIQAAIGVAQLNKLERIKERKHTIIGWYQRELSSIPHLRFLVVEPGSDYIPFRAMIFCPEAQTLMAHLQHHGIQTRTFFYPLHKQPCFAFLDCQAGGPLDLCDTTYPNAIAAYNQGIALPMFPTLTEETVHTIGTIITSFYNNPPPTPPDAHT